MKILVLSDLHLEISNFIAPQLQVDVVVLAGDIHKSNLGIYWARDAWPDKPIVYVAGNHKYFHSDRQTVLSLLRKAAEDTGVHFLDDEEVVINGVRFLGATLWTDFLLFGLTRQEICMDAGIKGLNDFSVIKENGALFSPSDAVMICNTSIRWLKNKLFNTSFEGKTVVATHHCPSWQSVAPKYQSDLLSACFASRLEDLMGNSELWIHGHTHESFDYEFNGTRVVCNPRGYVLRGSVENSSFEASKIVSVTKN